MINVSNNIKDIKKQIEDMYSVRVDEIKENLGELFIKVSKTPNVDLKELYRQLETEGELLHEETDYHQYFVLKK
jgi:hypothetical protein